MDNASSGVLPGRLLNTSAARLAFFAVLKLMDFLLEVANLTLKLPNLMLIDLAIGSNLILERSDQSRRIAFATVFQQA